VFSDIRRQRDDSHGEQDVNFADERKLDICLEEFCESSYSFLSVNNI